MAEYGSPLRSLVPAGDGRAPRPPSKSWFLAMLMASTFAAEQMRRLSIAVIDDDNPMRQAVGQLATRHTADEINRILSANPSLLDEGHSATFLELFGGGTIVDGEYVPVNVERIREALRLPEGPRLNNRASDDTSVVGCIPPAPTPGGTPLPPCRARLSPELR